MQLHLFSNRGAPKRGSMHEYYNLLLRRRMRLVCVLFLPQLVFVF